MMDMGELDGESTNHNQFPRRVHFLIAGSHGSDLPVCRRHLQAYQLLQLQLLVLCGSFDSRAALSTLEGAVEGTAPEGRTGKVPLYRCGFKL